MQVNCVRQSLRNILTDKNSYACMSVYFEYHHSIGISKERNSNKVRLKQGSALIGHYVYSLDQLLVCMYCTGSNLLNTVTEPLFHR